MPPPEVVCEQRSEFSSQICIDRPRALNALNIEIVQSIFNEYRRILTSEGSRPQIVLLKGLGGKAFCAGGDVKSVVRDAVAGNWQAGVDLFRAEMRLDYLISRIASASPNIIQVALLDGIVMGGGAGLCMHGPFRIATERTIFSMPECGIGLFPDVGASHFFQRLPAGLGLLLALTGLRLKGPELLWAGLATHFVKSQSLPALEAALVNPTDHVTARHGHHASLHPSALIDLRNVSGILDAFQEDGVRAPCNAWLATTPKPPSSSSTSPEDQEAWEQAQEHFRGLLAVAERHFTAVADISSLLAELSAAQQDAQFSRGNGASRVSSATAASPVHVPEALPSPELYKEVVEALRQASPISLSLTLHSMRAAVGKPLRDVLASDFRCVCHCTRHGWDFWEGVTARLMERRAPRWHHASAADVPVSYAATAFGPLGFCEELELRDVDALVDAVSAASPPAPLARL